MKTKSQGLIFWIILLLAALAWWFWPLEPASFGDADLQCIRPTVAENANGYAPLSRASAALCLPKAMESRLDALLSIPSSATNRIPRNGKVISPPKESKVMWDPELARQIMSSNLDAVNILEQALAAPHLLVPAPKALEDEFSYLKEYRALAKIMILEARIDVQAGEYQKASDQLFRAIQFGDQLQNAGGCYLHYLVGRAIKNMALAQIRYLAGTVTLPEVQLKDILTRVQNLRANTIGFTNAMKVEYQLCLNTMKDLRSGKGIVSDEMPRVVVYLAGHLAMRERTTRQLLGDKFRLVLRYADSNFNEIPLARFEPPTLDLLSGTCLLLQGNPLGALVSRLPPWSSYNATLVEEKVHLEATRAVVALLGYRQKTGALPRSWSDLTPEYLPEAPRDPFDGRPFRYLPDNKIIYSVGHNLKDDEGSSAIQDGHKLDLCFPFEFPMATHGREPIRGGP
jgi:hypothetical protein